MKPLPKRGGKSKETVIQELAQLTMSMMKKANPVADILNFYKPQNLYPFRQIDDQMSELM